LIFPKALAPKAFVRLQVLRTAAESSLSHEANDNSQDPETPLLVEVKRTRFCKDPGFNRHQQRAAGAAAAAAAASAPASITATTAKTKAKIRAKQHQRDTSMRRSLSR